MTVSVTFAYETGIVTVYPYLFTLKNERRENVLIIKNECLCGNINEE